MANRKNPYNGLESRAFWRPAVGTRNALDLEDLWYPRFALSPEDKVVTAGSCFAQHIGRALVRNGFNWFNAEPGPEARSDDDRAALQRYGYGVFSFRTGNIYTAALLRQWVTWSLSPKTQSNEIWETDGRFYDPQRPAIEPDGFANVEEVQAARQQLLSAIFRAITEARFFVFTMGLTEGWENKTSGVAYAMCPGTLAGDFDTRLHAFTNYSHARIYTDMLWTIDTMRQINPELRILLTVSPVPLTATASGDHVLCATMASKSTLRSVAEELRRECDIVDYFPSYEIIGSPTFRGMFYQPNQREVSSKGVDHVMTHFFSGLGVTPQSPPRLDLTSASYPLTLPEKAADDIQCEEVTLQAFEK